MPSACTDGNLGFNGALAAFRLPDESCASVLPALGASVPAEQGGPLSVASMCASTVSPWATSLAASGITWTPPAGATTYADVCQATCSSCSPPPVQPPSGPPPVCLLYTSPSPRDS